MGSWGSKPFQSDGALDFIYELERCHDIEDRLHDALSISEYSASANRCDEAYCAAGLVALSYGIDADNAPMLDEKVAAFVSGPVIKNALAKAIDAMTVIVELDGSSYVWYSDKATYQSSVRELLTQLQNILSSSTTEAP